MWECRDFPGALPEPGGLLDQPANALRRMRLVERAWRAVDGFHKAKSWTKWSKEHPDAWKLKCWIDKLRTAYD